MFNLPQAEAARSKYDFCLPKVNLLPCNCSKQITIEAFAEEESSNLRLAHDQGLDLELSLHFLWV